MASFMAYKWGWLTTNHLRTKDLPPKPNRFKPVSRVASTSNRTRQNTNTHLHSSSSPRSNRHSSGDLSEDDEEERRRGPNLAPGSEKYGSMTDPWDWDHETGTFTHQGINISHLGNRKIIDSKVPLKWDMLVPRRVPTMNGGFFMVNDVGIIYTPDLDGMGIGNTPCCFYC